MSYPARPVASLCLFLLVSGLSGCRTSPEAREAKFLSRGQALLAQKDYPRALLEFRNASSVMPKDAEPYFRMGLVYLESQDLQSAARAFQRAVTLDPKHSGAQLKLAELMAVSRDDNLVEEALTRLRNVFGPSPDNPEAIDTLAIAEWRLGKPEDAAQRLEEALKKFPTHLQSSVTLARMKLNRNDRKGAEEVLKKAATDAPQSSSAALALGELYVLMQQPSDAEPQFKRALQLDPKNGPALTALGAIQIAAKRMTEAEQTYKQLAALPEKAYKPLHAAFLYRFGDRQAAVAEFEVLVKADPNDRDLRRNLVAAYVGMNRTADAEKLLASALKRNSKDIDALLQRAELRLQFGRPDDAEKDVKDVLHFVPDSAAAHFVLARAYQAKGQLNNQQQELQQALRLDPTMLPVRLALEISYLASNHHQAALEAIDGAPDNQKEQLLWMMGRNWALIAAGNLREAETSIQRALKEGRSPEVIYQYAVLRFIQHDYSAARTQLEELLHQGITDPRVADLVVKSYAAQKELPKGLARLKEITAAYPQSAPLRQLLGNWCARVGNTDEARKAYEAALAADRHFVSADLSLAEMEIEERHYDAAQKRLTAILETNPNNVPALLLSARVAGAAKDDALMVVRYRAVLDADASNIIALNNLAYILAPSNPDEALRLGQRALELASDSPNIQDTLGWVYYRKGMYSMAARYLKSAVDRESTPRRQFHLGMSYLKMGDQVAGQRLVNAALAKDPNLPSTEQGW